MIRHKFNAKPVVDDGHRFPSKLEHAYYQYLTLLKKTGEVIFFLRQIPFHLPGGVKYILDFMIFFKNGDIIFADTKGKKTAEFIAKKKIVEALYPITITIVERKDF